MLKGESVILRSVSESDLEPLLQFHTDIDNRGAYYPRGVASRPAFFHQYQQDGFWGRDDGMLVITSHEAEILGHIEVFKTVNYLDEYELLYQIYGQEKRRRGAMTQAPNLMVTFLFETRRMNRIRLVIHPDNAASRGLATKCGFRHEGTARGAWFNKGTHHDVEIYAILRADVIPTSR